MSAFHAQKRELLGILQKEVHKVPFTKYYCKLLRKTVLRKLAELCEKRDKILQRLVKYYDDLKRLTEWTMLWNSHEVWFFLVVRSINKLRKCEVEIIKFLDDAPNSGVASLIGGTIGNFVEKVGLGSSGFFVFMNLRSRDEGMVCFNVLLKVGKSIEFLKYDFVEKYFVSKEVGKNWFCMKRDRVVPIVEKSKTDLLRFIDNSFYIRPTYTTREADWLIGLDALSMEVAEK